MELKITTKVLNSIGNGLLPEQNVELEILRQYKYNREDHNLYDAAGKILLEHYFGDEEEYNINKLSSFFKESTFITIVTKFLETVDILLLNQIEDIDFLDIIYLGENEDEFIFKVLGKDDK